MVNEPNKKAEREVWQFGSGQRVAAGRRLIVPPRGTAMRRARRSPEWNVMCLGSQKRHGIVHKAPDSHKRQRVYNAGVYVSLHRVARQNMCRGMFNVPPQIMFKHMSCVVTVFHCEWLA